MKEDFLFNHEVAALKEQGVTLNDLRGEEVVELVKAVEGLRNPFSGVNLDVIGQPIDVKGGATLWKLTVGATVWLAEYAQKWWMDTGMEKSYFWALVYASVNARNPDAFITDKEEAHKRITALALKLAVYEADLVSAVNDALEVRKSRPSNPNAPQTDMQTDWASVVARLEGQTGIPAEKWCWGRSADYALRVHEDLVRFAELAQGRKVGRMRDEADEATSRLAKIRAYIVERVAADRKAAQEKEKEAAS